MQDKQKSRHSTRLIKGHFYNYSSAVCALALTRNMTSITEVWSTSARLFASTWRPLPIVITTLYYVAIIFHRWVWCRALPLCNACILKFRHHPHPLGYLCAKFCFCHASIADRVRTPGYVPKKTRWVFLGKPTLRNPVKNPGKKTRPKTSKLWCHIPQ